MSENRVLLAYRQFSSSFTAYPWMLARGVSVDAVGPFRHPVRHSRYLDHFFGSADTDAAFVDLLRTRLDAGEYSMLLCVDEPARDLLFTHRTDPILQDWLPFANNSGLIEAVGDKTRFYQWCAQHGIAAPRTKVCTNLDAARNAADLFGYPVMLKNPVGFGGRGIFRISNACELEQIFPEEPVDPPYLVQEFVDGPVGSTSFLSYRGDVFACVSSEKYISLSGGLGPSAIRRFNPDPILADIARRIARAGGITGLTGFDWMQIGPGNYRVIDPHLGRGTTTSVISDHAGVDMGAALLAALEGGTPQPEQNESREIHWMFPQLIELIYQGRLFHALRRANPLRRDVHIFWKAPGEGRVFLSLLREYLLVQTRILLGRLNRRFGS